MNLADLIDLRAFPIHTPASAGYVAAVDRARAGLRSEGCAVLGGFVRPEAVAKLNDEVVARKHATHYSTQVINPYFHTSFNPDYPPEHPVNTFIERSSGFIPGDAWDPCCATETLFRAPEVARFIADCLEIPALYCYGDLQIFRGRHSLHRVTRVGAGSPPRHAAIFAYTLEPGVVGRVERTLQLFGRVLPEHEEAAQRGVQCLRPGVRCLRRAGFKSVARGFRCAFGVREPRSSGRTLLNTRPHPRS